jgi:hypothetical protein
MGDADNYGCSAKKPMDEDAACEPQTKARTRAASSVIFVSQNWPSVDVN